MGQSSSARVGIQIPPLSLVGPGVQSPPPEPSDSSDAESEETPAVVTTPWPGSDFKVESILPGSVYLWACGEPVPGDDIPRVSRSQAAAAWVILITQAACYAGLWCVSGNQPSADTQPSSENENVSEITPDYSIVAIAGAMYLILSIAAADVWCGCALIFEGRGPGFVLFTRRRVFGVFLLGTFLALVGASIRVLFYSADEDVQLVLGAAAVLFIADVDEKAMSVLKNISGEWVLFWVLEVIGLSFGLALFAVKVTGNTGAIDNKDEAHGCTSSTPGGCDIFNWGFIMTLQSTAVTAFAFLLTSIVSRNRSSFAGYIILPRSWKGLVITLFILCWLGQAPLWLVHAVASTWFDTFSAGCALLFVMICCRLELTCANWKKMWRKGVRQGGRRLLCFGGFLISLSLILEVLSLYTSSEDVGVLYLKFSDCFYVLEILFAALYLIMYLWLINGLRLANLRSAELDPNVALISFLRPMILGWSLSEGLFAMHYWVFLHAWQLEQLYPHIRPGILLAEQLAWLVRHLIVGTVLWGEAAGTRGVGYWTAATFIRTIVVDCVSTWIFAGLDQTVT